MKRVKKMKMNDRMRAAYEAPQVEIIEVEVEKGFATSGSGVYGEGDDIQIQ